MSDLIRPSISRSDAGPVANQVAYKYVLGNYLERKSNQTRRRQTADLKLFARYLTIAGIDAMGIALDVYHFKTYGENDTPLTLEDWGDITYGLVQGFVNWQLLEGYAVHSVNIRLSTIKQYCKLATMSGILPASELAMINLVKGYREAEAKHIDENRDEDKRRKGAKKAAPTLITKEQRALLKNQPDTPQGRRDQLLICLLLDHGLRCGEIAALEMEAINLHDGKMTFSRPKVDKVQTHEFTRASLLAVTNYLEIRPKNDFKKLIMGSNNKGELVGGMKERAITARVNVLGKRVGVDKLSAHDGRHDWATRAARSGTHIKALQDAGGWNSPVMPLRYVESQKVANEGVKLDD